MAEEEKLTIDETLAKLDQKSRAARIFSIALTVLSVVILLFLIFLSYQAGQELFLLKASADSYRILAEEENTKYTETKAKKDLLLKEIAELANVQNSNKSPAEKNSKTNQVLSKASNITGIDYTNILVPTTTPTVSQDLADISKVFIQIVDEAQRPEAKRISQVLRSKGLNVPSIEFIRGLGGKVKGNQIRYFDEEEIKLAKKLESLLNSNGIKFERIRYIPLSVEKGRLEIWLAN